MVTTPNSFESFSRLTTVCTSNTKRGGDVDLVDARGDVAFSGAGSWADADAAVGERMVAIREVFSDYCFQLRTLASPSSGVR